MNRRSILKTVGLAITGSVLLHFSPIAQNKNSDLDSKRQDDTRKALSGRRNLGSLEVSSVGLGVQNMSRTYQQTASKYSNYWRAITNQGVTVFRSRSTQEKVMYNFVSCFVKSVYSVEPNF